MPGLLDLRIPTGSITGSKLSGTIASTQIDANAIDVTKLAATLDISGKTVTMPNGVLTTSSLPSGSIIGHYYVSGQYNFSYTTSSGTYNDVPSFNVTFTTKATNSTFLVHIRTTGYADAGHGGVAIGMKLGSTLYVGGSSDQWSLWGNGVNNGGSYNPMRHQLISPSLAAGTSVTAQVVAGAWSGSGTKWLPGYSSSYTNLASLSIYEIKP